MRRMAWSVGACLVVLTLAGAPAMGQVTFYFSIDLGSDVDLSDPNGDGDEALDCGEVFSEPATLLAKDEDGGSPNMGYPYAIGTAVQPLPSQVGAASDTSGYALFLDLDGEDQTEHFLEWVGEPPVPAVYLTGPVPGLALEPMHIALSFEDDGAAGWAVSGDVPTMAAGDDATEIYADTGTFGVWSPADLTAVRDEATLGLGSNPGTQPNDDDVDALDVEEWSNWYFTVDHEANLGDDPGSIYLTVLTTAGRNKALAVDDVYGATSYGLGVSEATDVDAIEFVALTETTYNSIFSTSLTPTGQPILCVLFSVDADDPDTAGTDESGGLLPTVVYISNLLGTRVALADYGTSGDIDAIATSETAVPVELMRFSVE
jgi:hypothetical protein